jgi:CrcB protein
MEWVLIAIGGAVGSLCRYAVGQIVQRASHGGFPMGTLVVNVLGCMIVGGLTGWLMNAQTHPLIRPALVVGFCGGFTTFSTFSMETVALMRGGEIAMAATYVGASLVLGVSAAAFAFVAVSARA